MTIRPILEVPDRRLRQKSKPVETIDADMKTLISDMFETMYAAPGIGLAAIQVGVPLRLLVMDLVDGPANADGEATNNPHVFINPELSEPSGEKKVFQEGCLSIPEQFADVERPAAIRARWLDENGVAHDAHLEGLLATCLQHETDHLEGILFIDHLSRLKKSMLLKKLEKWRSSEEEAA